MVDTESFWNGVAEIYSKSSMTHHMADFELGTVMEVLDTLEIKSMACFGAADGNREPLSLLNHLVETKKSLPKEILINDISANMISQCKINLAKGGWFMNKDIDIKFIHKPLISLTEKFNLGPMKINYCIGVYNANYLQESLELYQLNKEVVGELFHVYPLYFSDGILKAGDGIQFKIEKYLEKMPELTKMREPTGFYGYGIITDNNFISHYFDEKMLQIVMRSVFKNHNISVKVGKDNFRRYIVYVIQSKLDGCDCIVTMLNNVLGNIKYDQHIGSLEKLFSLELKVPVTSASSSV